MWGRLATLRQPKKLAEQPIFSAAAPLPSGLTLQFPRVYGSIEKIALFAVFCGGAFPTIKFAWIVCQSKLVGNSLES